MMPASRLVDFLLHGPQEHVSSSLSKFCPFRAKIGSRTLAPVRPPKGSVGLKRVFERMSMSLFCLCDNYDESCEVIFSKIFDAQN